MASGEIAAGVIMCVWISVIKADVLYIPEIVSSNASGRLTSTTVMLELPLCYFDSLNSLPCTPNQCEIWLVVAKDMGIQRFDGEKTSSDILTRSPYPDAFQTQGSPNYFLTKVGSRRSFLCHGEATEDSYFRVGAQGVCEETNCNGILPTGSTIRVKYVLVDLNSIIQSESSWSQPVTLITPHSLSSIDEWIGKRSGGMVVITVISSCLLALLLLLLGAVLLLDCYDSSKGQMEISTSSPISTGITNYNTHHLSNYYSNVH